MAQIVIADIDCYDPSIPGVRTLRFATQGYVTGSLDSPSSTFYDGRIQQPANVLRSCFQQGRTFGMTQIGYGDMVLVNNDGELDGLLNYSFAGRAITIKLGTMLPNQSSPTWITVLKGTMEQAELSWQKVTIRVRDRQQDLAKPIQQTRFAGTNILPNGLEGVDTDLQGKPKPLVFGLVYNINPPQVNTTRRIYQVNEGTALQSLIAVYDRGTVLTRGADYTSQSDMETNAPSSGQYRVWNHATLGCFFRLGNTPSGLVTCDAQQGANLAVGDLYNAILNEAGIASGDISSSDISLLNALNPAVCGVYAGYEQDVTPIQLIDELVGSIGAWYGSDANGVFRIGRIEVPMGTSVGTISATEILKIERVSSKDPGVGIPVWKVKLGWQKIWNVQNDTTANVTDVRKQFLSAQWRTYEASDSTVKAVNATSPELTINTVLANKGDALIEVVRLLTQYKTRRDMYQVTIRVDSTLASVLDLGKVITLQVNRFGMNAGKKFLIIGIRTNMRGYQFELTLWG